MTGEESKTTQNSVDLLTFKTRVDDNESDDDNARLNQAMGGQQLNELKSRRVYDVHQGEPWFRLIQFNDFSQLYAFEEKLRRQRLQQASAGQARLQEDFIESQEDLGNGTGSAEDFDADAEPDPFSELRDPVKVHIVTPRGMVGSQRTRWQGDLQVGRYAGRHENAVPNDIVLPSDDLGVSRIHFRIIY